jgi:hypothetical protein
VCVTAIRLVPTVPSAIQSHYSVHVSQELEINSVIAVSLGTGVCPLSMRVTVDAHVSNVLASYLFSYFDYHNIGSRSVPLKIVYSLFMLQIYVQRQCLYVSVESIVDSLSGPGSISCGIHGNIQ